MLFARSGIFSMFTNITPVKPDIFLLMNLIEKKKIYKCVHVFYVEYHI